MNKNKYVAEVSALSTEIEKRGDVWELFYQRGYLHFLLDEDTKAKNDYKKAVELGLDVTEHPYYTFATTNEKRRDFLLPEKIMITLILIIITFTLFSQIVNWYLKIKTLL